MQEQENDISSPEPTESSEPNLSADPVDIFPEPEEATEPKSAGEDQADQPKEETRARRFFRRVIRWTAGLLVVFGLGFLAAVFLIYTPKVDELELTKGQVEDSADTISEKDNQIASLQDQILALNGQIDDLNQQIESLETENQDLKTAQDQFNLHIALLKARADIASAQVEIFGGIPAQARILLQNTDQTLNTIESLLDDDLKDVIGPLRTRLELAISEIDSDPDTAIDDLSILVGDLLEIENALFNQ